MYVYIRIYVCTIYICTYTYILLYTHSHTYIYTNAHRHTHIQSPTSGNDMTCTPSNRTLRYTYIHARMHRVIQVRTTHTYIHKYIHTYRIPTTQHIHTYIHTYIHAQDNQTAQHIHTYIHIIFKLLSTYIYIHIIFKLLSTYTHTYIGSIPLLTAPCLILTTIPDNGMAALNIKAAATPGGSIPQQGRAAASHPISCAWLHVCT